MLTGNIRNQVDAIWNTFWSGGIANPLEVIEQITYLLFLERLDDLHTLEENKAARLKLKKLERRVFPSGDDPKGRAYEDFRWSRFKHFEAKEMFAVVNDHVFPFLRTLGGDDSTYARHMKDARFTIPTPALLAPVPHPAPYHQIDGGARPAGAHGHHVRPRQRHLRFSRGGW
jgi:type I restriction enzyme M protein